VKYEITYGGIHAGAEFQGKSASNPGTAQEFVLGWNFEGGAIDAFYVQKNDAIAAGSLSAAQVADVTAVCAGTASTTVAADYSCAAIDKAVAGTISDTTTTAIMGKYAFASVHTTVSAGYEQIRFTNPSDPIAPNSGQATIGGYTLVTTSNTAYPSTKTLDISWIGAKYSPTAQVDLSFAYYRYDQNSFSTAHPGCSSAATSSQCSGSENFVSFVADYHFTKRFDTYGGAMWSQVQGGLANGYLHTSTIDPTVGFRYNF
jgi:predicted porin